ncbi:MAG: glycoside hydrolase family 3 C-terminal domain-containing protein [Clostridia bacterium]|nr:glycoside hydrolase family 3 C-terminal domain-containing protein [Clostridia bacterium]MBQ6721174.1 glycoside hydrolase family 3 C-terminal domain-containing protein [Clostridia bacterium]
MAKIYATKNPEISAREIRNMNRCRSIAAEGMVLLENKGALPLKNVKTVAAFGGGVRRTIKGGIGSGDVNSRLVVNIEQGLEEAGLTVTTKEWLDQYDVICQKAQEAAFARISALLAEKGAAALMDLLAERPRDPALPEITGETLEKTRADAAIFVISRNSGEGADRKAAPGDYELTDDEKNCLDTLTAAYGSVIVVLNVGGVIDTKYLRNKAGIGAVLLMSQAGCVSGHALADVLTGRETPSGRLAMTWAENYEDYPSAAIFSHVSGDLDDAWYNEGIYVGYRYFDTFGVKPAYPFGYGLSYTEFKQQVQAVRISGETVEVLVSVTNTGAACAGREVVQVYYSAPAGTLEKPYQELAGFAKTGILKPGESETLKITFAIRSMASYDEKRAAWVLEAGTYYIRVGSHSRNTHIAAALVIAEEKITEKLSNRLVPDHPIQEISSRNTTAYTYPGEQAEKEKALTIEIITATIRTEEAVYSGTPEEMHTGKKEQITLADILAGRATAEEMTAQLTKEELATLCIGNERGGMFGGPQAGGPQIGAASVAVPGGAGDTTSILLESRGVPNIVLADGPAGLRLSRTFVADSQDHVIPGLGESALGGMEKLFGAVAPERPADAVDYYQYCTAIPIATLLAQTWDMEAVAAAGDIVGEEMEEFGVTLWLAPGMNIQRNPLCGRNFEYYSEDPLLSGKCAAADTLAVQRHPGCGTTIKHFALNNQEDNRNFCNSHCSERALREIYLRGFEIAVRESQPLSLMTSYNLVNGIHSANSYELLTSVLRDEWGFRGVVMTDWGTTGEETLEGPQQKKYPTSNSAGCIKAGNDLTMPGSQADVDHILEALNSTKDKAAYPITLGELQACACRILKLVLACGKSRAENRN